MITGNTIFMTGGQGFIASNLAKHLVESNKIVAYDNGTRNALSFLGIENHANFTLITGDVLDLEGVEKAMNGCNIVVHAAAIAGVSSYYEQPIKTMEVNFIGTSNVLKAALRNKQIKHFLNFSTSEVYGINALNVSEKDDTVQKHVGDSRWTYSMSKIAADHLTFAYYTKEKLPVTSLRPFNIYGPGQVGVGALNQFCKDAVNNQDLKVTNDGSQIRAWCHIKDTVDAIMLCLEKRDRSVGEVFNIGNSEAKATILDLAKKVVEISKSKSKVVFEPHMGTDVQVRIPSIEKAKQILGYSPKFDLQAGIKDTIEWYKKDI